MQVIYDPTGSITFRTGTTIESDNADSTSRLSSHQKGDVSWFSWEHSDESVSPNVRRFSSNSFSVFEVLSEQKPIHSVLERVYAFSYQGLEDKALLTLYRATEGAFAEGNLAFVDNLLKSFEPSRVNRMVSVGALRGTFRARSMLPSWQSCLEEVAATLLEREPDKALHFLRGMIIKTNGRNLLPKN